MLIDSSKYRKKLGLRMGQSRSA